MHRARGRDDLLSLRHEPFHVLGLYGVPEVAERVPVGGAAKPAKVAEKVHLVGDAAAETVEGHVRHVVPAEARLVAGDLLGADQARVVHLLEGRVARAEPAARVASAPGLFPGAPIKVRDADAVGRLATRETADAAIVRLVRLDGAFAQVHVRTLLVKHYALQALYVLKIARGVRQLRVVPDFDVGGVGQPRRAPLKGGAIGDLLQVHRLLFGGGHD